MNIIIIIRLTIAAEAFIPFVHETVVHCIVFEMVAICLQVRFYRFIADTNLRIEQK